MTALAIVLAGGSGSRMGLDRNKVYVPLDGRPVLAWSLGTFGSSTGIDHIVLVHRDVDVAEVSDVIAAHHIPKLTDIVVGGATRTGSELAGLAVVRALILSGGLKRSDIVLIHDGARPFVTHDLIDQLVDAADRHGGALPGFAMRGAIAKIGGDGRLHAVELAPLRRVQTPQCFRAGELLDAYDAAGAFGFDGVDTAEVLERFAPSGFRTAVVEADERNIKITVAADLDRARRIARSWTESGWIDPSANRTAPRDRSSSSPVRRGAVRERVGEHVQPRVTFVPRARDIQEF